MLNQDLVDGLKAVTAQVTTVQAEVVNVEAVLAAQAPTNQVPQAVADAFAGLKSAMQGLVDTAASLPAPAAAPSDGTPAAT